MPAFTEFLGKPIRDPNGEAVAACTISWCA